MAQTDILTRLVAYAERKGERVNPVLASVRQQVKDLVQSITGPKPVMERNREGMIRTYAERRNHLGQTQQFYAGTVSPKVKAKRRAANRMARRTRQVQRRARA